jgi:ABC-type amino acid transport substrate-binding protein
VSYASLVEKSDINTTLSEHEKSWILSHPVLKMGVDRDFKPYEWIDENGKYKGLSADYMKLVQKYLGIKFEIVKDKSWAQILEMAKLGEIDMISDAVKTPERDKYLDFTEPFISTPIVIVDNGKLGYLDSIERLKGKRVAVERGYFISELLTQDYPEIIQVVASNGHDALNAVLNGDADAYLGDAGLVSNLIRSSNMLTLRISGQTNYVSHHSMAATIYNPELVSILNKALASISIDKRKEMTQNWFSLSIENGINKETVFKYALLAIIILSVILYWNWRLLKEIEKRNLLEI